MLLRDLGHQAEKEGGAVYMINGNHESLNVCGNFRSVRTLLKSVRRVMVCVGMLREEPIMNRHLPLV